MPFARWESFEACVLEQKETGHSDESARKICGAIQERAEKGELFKQDQWELDILSKEDVEGDLVVGGYSTWELRDPQNDIVTTQAQVRFLQRLFKLDPEYQNITVKHGDFKIGKPLLTYAGNGHEYFSHVNERGTYLVSKIRNDKLKSTQMFRERILKGELGMYSISGLPIESTEELDGKEVVRKVLDLEPWAVTLCERGVNPKAKVTVISKEQPRTDEERAKAHFNLSDEEWNKLTDEERQAYIAKLPPRGAGQEPKQADVGTPGIEYETVKITAIPGQIVLVERGTELSKMETEEIFRKHGFSKCHAPS